MIDKKFIAVVQFVPIIFLILTQFVRLIAIISAIVYEKQSAKFQNMPTFAISRKIMIFGTVSHFFLDLGLPFFSLLKQKKKERKRGSRENEDLF